MAGVGNTQIINGQSYELYSPAWYAARDASKVQQAGVTGTAAGTETKAAADSSGLTDQLNKVTAGLSGGATSTAKASSSAPATVAFGGGGATGVGTSGGNVTTGGGAGPNPQASQAAAFARAKDSAGNLARSSITALNDEMAGRGVLNSGITNQGLVDKLAAASNPLADVITGQLGDSYQAAQHDKDLANSNAQVQYQGAITQRGQDIQSNIAGNSLAAQSASAQQALLLNALKGISGSLGY